MDNRLLIGLWIGALALLNPGLALAANVQKVPPLATQYNQAQWWHGCASLDLDFYNDRYYINHNTTCDGTIGTQYSGVANFITGTSATFTRAGTTNITDTQPPFYLSTSQGQAFVSRSTTGTYFDNTGTLQTAAINTARDNHNELSPYADLGTLIEPAATNTIRNNSMTGVAAATTITPQTVTNMARSVNVVTVTTGSAHGLAVGNIITMTGAAPAAYNGTYAVTSITSTTKFTYTVPSNPGANTANGSYTATTTGTLPTNWSWSGLTNGITMSIVATGTTLGVAYADLRVAGTATATTASIISFDSTSGIAAVNGQNWTESIFLNVVGGSTTNASNLFGWNLYNSSSTLLTNQTLSSVVWPTNLNRFSQSAAIGTASTAFIAPYFVVSVASGNSVDITVRIGMPQLEQSSYSTSTIATTTAAVSRAADVYSQPSGGTYYNSAGVLVNAAVNTPRLDHSPVSPYPPVGVLIEESRTNSITYSVPDNGTTWTYAADNSAGSANSITSPDGYTNGTALSDTTSTSSHYTTPTATIAFTSGTSYTFSAFVQAGTATAVQLELPATAFGTAYASFSLTSATQATSGVVATNQTVGNWSRLSITATATSTVSASPAIALTNSLVTASALPSYLGTGQTLYIWGAQMEVGGQPTSYIPTYGSTVTRAQEVFTVPGTAGGGSGWIHNNVGTLGTVGSINLPVTTHGFAGIDDGTASNVIYTMINPSNKRVGATIVGGSAAYTGVLSPNTGYTAGNRTKIVIAFSAADENGATDGSAFGSAGTNALPTTQSRLTIGHTRNVTGDLDGWVTRLWYMPVRDVNASLPQYSQ